MSAARPRPPAPPPQGSPGGKRLLLREPPLPCVVGVPLPTPRPAQPSPAPTRRFDYKTALRWQLHPGFLPPLFQPSLGYFSAFWLPLLFSSSLCPGDPPLLSLLPFPIYVVSQAVNRFRIGRPLQCPSCSSSPPVLLPQTLPRAAACLPFPQSLCAAPARVPVPELRAAAPLPFRVSSGSITAPPTGAPLLEPGGCPCPCPPGSHRPSRTALS